MSEMVGESHKKTRHATLTLGGHFSIIHNLSTFGVVLFGTLGVREQGSSTELSDSWLYGLCCMFGGKHSTSNIHPFKGMFECFHIREGQLPAVSHCRGNRTKSNRSMGIMSPPPPPNYTSIGVSVGGGGGGHKALVSGN